MPTPLQHARNVVRSRGGVLRTKELLAAGIHPRTLYAMRDSGELERLARGVYRLAELPVCIDSELVTVAKRVPNGVVCLISALAFHELITQIPHAVHLALPRTARNPALRFPPIQVYRFDGPSLIAGVETPRIDGVSVKIYSAEKTLADCFKFRNRIGVDVAMEGFKNYCKRRRPNLQRVLEFARICRVEQVMRPYLEASA
jgi:predicted transcriptional regulator of viral defense system